MSKPWLHTLESIDPNYQELARIMDKGPIIKPNLSHKNQKWNLSIDEVWPDFGIEATSGKLDERVEWVANELQKWDEVRRTSWRTWTFPNKYLADKFITYYYIKWDR